jgi:hypothetical protein
MRINEYYDFVKDQFNYDGSMSVWSNRHWAACLYSLKLFVADKDRFDMYWVKSENIIGGTGDRMVVAIRLDKGIPFLQEPVKLNRVIVQEWIRNYFSEGEELKPKKTLVHLMTMYDNFQYPEMFGEEIDDFKNNLNRLVRMCKKGLEF